MNRTVILLASAAALLSACAKPVTTSLNESSKRYLEAFIQTHYPDARKTSLGAYVIEEEKGTGKALGDTATTPFVRVEYTTTDLNGNIASTTFRTVSQQIGTFENGNYYGPVVWYRPLFSVYAGLEESLKEMNVGGRRKIIIPGWLMSYSEYTTAQEFEDNCSGTDVIYDLRVVEGITDIAKWQIDSIAGYLSRNFPEVSPEDSAAYGYYYIQRQPPVDTTKFPTDTTFYINYIGRLLDGTVFDTNIKDTAKFYNIYSASKTYSPSAITYDSENSVFLMGESTVVTGFEMTLERIRDKEKATAIFYSELGYGSSASGSTIPAFSPLRFDVDVVDNSN